ncbi:MAG: RagB/SusD family nutrient uptake outer membrane protein [Sphingobacteriia bacterium]|nr:RagB/SusD family nutrient uptake outer membrane protein [Sphingobacteriia bacterium]
MFTNHNTNKVRILIVTLTLLSALSSCKKNLQVSPVGSISTQTAYSNATNIEASVNGIYYILQQNGVIYNSYYNSVFPLLDDEAMTGNTTNLPTLQFASNQLTIDNSIVAGLWQNNYQTIYQANMLLANVPGVNGLDGGKKNQWIGEARFLRAYCYFMLTRYFGKVPLATTTDYAVNNSLLRKDTATVNQFIISELEQAVKELPNDYAAYNGSRTRACKQTAQALLAREYLYQGIWDKAEANATSVISDNTFSMPTSLDNVVAPNSPESIWEIAFSTSVQNQTATLLVPVLSSPVVPAVLPSNKLIQSFEAGDLRKSKYMAFSPTPSPGFYYVNKFRDRTTFSDQPKILRLSEMYLIRAEARAQQNNLAGAAADINVIRNRAGLQGTPASTQVQLLAAVMQERFVELCFEGHRWPDLIRTGQADAVLSIFKGSNWKTTDQLFPIPGVEIGNNANLNPQNPGY